MIEISLTHFVDYVIKSGTPKLTVVRKTKDQLSEEYDPITDYYKSIRDMIVKYHKGKCSLADIGSLADEVTNKSKKANYPLIAKGHKKFVGRKPIKWFAPPRTPWTHGDLTVSLNPELGLEIGGKRHLVKLYFKGDQPRKLEVDAILALMEMSFQTSSNPKTMGLLDVRRGKLITETDFDESLEYLIKGEALSFASIFNSL